MTDTTTTTTAATTTAATPWHQGVDAEILGHWQNKNYDLSDPAKVAIEVTKQARELQKHFGIPADRLLRLPEKPDDEAGWKSVHQRLGVPKDVKEYDFNGVKFSDGTELDETFTTAMRSALLKSNVAKEAAPEIVKTVIKYLDDADSAEKATTTAKLNEQKENLRKSWGPKHDENLLAAKQGARRLGVEPEAVAALESIVGYDKIMEMFRKIGAGTSEDTFVESKRSGDPVTAQGAVARLAELEADPAWQKRLLNKDAATWREFRALSEQIASAA